MYICVGTVCVMRIQYIVFYVANNTTLPAAVVLEAPFNSLLNAILYHPFALVRLLIFVWLIIIGIVSTLVFL